VSGDAHPGNWNNMENELRVQWDLDTLNGSYLSAKGYINTGKLNAKHTNAWSPGTRQFRYLKDEAGTLF